ncbi:MAG: alanine racemase [Bacillota bacterium]|nr:alanine racemase [Bacillota bacterium]
MSDRTAHDCSASQTSQRLPRKHPPRHHSAWVDVDLDALVFNCQAISRYIAPARMIAVVKAYGLGTGAVMAGRALEEAGVYMLAVSNFHEAILLRKEGIRCPVLAMNGLLPEQMELAIAQDISFFGFDAASLRTADALGKKLCRRAKVHIKVDTGMGRLGILPEEAGATRLLLEGLTWVDLEGIASHIASPIAAEHNDFTFRQHATFLKVCETIDPRHRVVRHISSSNTVMRLPELNMDAVRCQAVLWGVSYIWPTPWPLKPVASYKARLVQVKTLPAGHNVGYRLKYSTARPTQLGILPLGTIDGLTADHAGKGYVLVRGQRCPILAVCTCESMVDVTDVPGAQAGDEVVLVGEQRGETLSAMEFAEMGGISFMNLLTKTGARVPRVYWRNGSYVNTEVFNQEDWE